VKTSKLFDTKSNSLETIPLKAKEAQYSAFKNKTNSQSLRDLDDFIPHQYDKL
jgi:hypothetical protein